jgi:cytochrome c1
MGVAASVLFAAAAAAQDSPAPAGGPDHDCPPNATHASAKAAHPVRHAKVKATKTRLSGSGTAAAVGSGYPVLRNTFSQCTSIKNRGARAECVRTAYESRYGSPGNPRISGSGTSLASAATRKPCL